jgi:hypothetical protein
MVFFSVVISLRFFRAKALGTPPPNLLWQKDGEPIFVTKESTLLSSSENNQKKRNKNQNSQGIKIGKCGIKYQNSFYSYTPVNLLCWNFRTISMGARNRV